MLRRIVDALLGRRHKSPQYTRRELLALGAAAGAGLLSSTCHAAGKATGQKRVLVVGAGFAGLACAYELHAAGYDVHVLEARSRVGGRVLTIRNVAGGKTAEGGGELLGSNHPLVLAYAERFGLEFLEVTQDPPDVREPVLIDGIPLSEAALQQTNREIDEACAAMTDDARPVDPDEPWNSHNAAALDRRNTADWIAGLPVSPLTKRLLAVSFSGDNSVPVRRQSYLGNLAQVRGGGLERYWDETEVYRCRGGNQQFAQKLAAALGDRVRLNCPIVRIDVCDRGASAIDGGGRCWSADDLVLTAPPSVWSKIVFCPNLPAELQPQMGTAVKYLAVVNERFWEAQGVSASSMSDGQMTYTWHATDGQSTASGDAAVLTAFSGAEAALQCRNSRSSRDLEQQYGGRFTAIYPDFRRHFQSGAFYDWVGDPWTQAGYSFPAPGQVTTQGPLLHRGLGRLHFAGEHTCYKFVGYMEGGLNSGAALAQRLARRDGVIA